MNDYTTDKWEGLNEILDEKTEILATDIGNRLQSALSGTQFGLQSTSTQPVMPVMSTTNFNGNTPNHPTSQSKWVEYSVLASITDLKFDPVNLHKLSSPENVIRFNFNLNHKQSYNFQKPYIPCNSCLLPMSLESSPSSLVNPSLTTRTWSV
jgi:hypothetical protein